MKIPSILAGVAGEYFVAAELSRRGHIASISLRNTRGIDILATNREASRSVTIQCKTKQSTRRATIWILNENCETYFSDTHFYVLIALGAVGERPRYHIVPSCDVAKYVSKSHREWLRKRGRGGRRHVDNPIRNFSDPQNRYLEKWDLLGL